MKGDMSQTFQFPTDYKNKSNNKGPFDCEAENFLEC